MLDLLRALRPYQWTKNLLVFAGPVFALELFERRQALISLATFGLFCAASSAVYLCNDIFDRERDRKHPTKARRPIASGRVGAPAAAVTALALGLLALVGSWSIHRELALVVITYFVLQTAYTLGLKNMAIIDAMCVAAGFLLRAVAGAVAVQVPVSSWLLVCTIFLSLFISLAKRRHEFSNLAAAGAGHRQSLSGYTLPLLDQLITISAASTIISYALYTTDPETIAKMGHSDLIVTLPLVAYGMFRYLSLIQRDVWAGDPAMALLKDRPLQATVVLWCVAVVALLYVR